MLVPTSALKVHSKRHLIELTPCNTVPIHRQIRSLASLSVGAYDELKDDPMFSYFVYGFDRLGRKERHDAGSYGNGPAHEYAHTLVSDLFDIQQIESAIMASLVLNVWMFVIHHLYEFLRSCQNHDRSGMLQALDIAAALWIGTMDTPEAQERGGYSLYHLAQAVQTHFKHSNSDAPRGESHANHLFVTTLQSFQAQAKTPGMCEEEESFVQFRSLVHQAIGYATIPLVQLLVNEVMQTEDGSPATDVAVYGFTIAPRLAICNPIYFGRFYQKFVREQFQVSEKKLNIERLQSIYSCLEVSCVHVGSYRKAGMPSCIDDNKDATAPVIVGYQTHSSQVRPVRCSSCLAHYGSM